MKWLLGLLSLLFVSLCGLFGRRKNEIKDDVNKLDGGIKLSILKSDKLRGPK